MKIGDYIWKRKRLKQLLDSKLKKILLMRVRNKIYSFSKREREFLPLYILLAHSFPVSLWMQQWISTVLGGESDFANEECVARRKKTHVLLPWIPPLSLLLTHIKRAKKKKKITHLVRKFIQIVDGVHNWMYMP